MRAKSGPTAAPGARPARGATRPSRRTPAEDTLTVLTGVKPTAMPHLGNYLGAMRPALHAAAGHRAMLFIPDYHPLTTIRDAEELRRLTYEVAATWLAIGLDPERVIVYRQSDIPETFELFW